MPELVYLTIRDAEVDRTECVNSLINIDRDAGGGIVGIEVFAVTGIEVDGQSIALPTEEGQS